MSRSPTFRRKEIEGFVERFITYYNQYRAHGGLGYEPPIHWYLGTSPKVKGLGGIPGLERVAQEWSGESFAEDPILVNQQVLARRSPTDWKSESSGAHFVRNSHMCVDCTIFSCYENKSFRPGGIADSKINIEWKTLLKLCTPEGGRFLDLYASTGLSQNNLNC